MITDYRFFSIQNTIVHRRSFPGDRMEMSRGTGNRLPDNSECGMRRAECGMRNDGVVIRFSDISARDVLGLSDPYVGWRFG